MTDFTLNGEAASVDADPTTPLLWIIRERVGLTGTKYGCGVGACGACTVHIDGQPVPSCSLPLSAAEGAEITTIEGLSLDGSHPVQQAWVEVDVPQCGYCQSGQIMACAAMIRDVPDPTDADIDAYLAGNLCRCGVYNRIRVAAKRAAEIARG
ncbi:(2Fe-2S)-binding protein [Litoreibacter roseus]|uniref:Isoquinoline 1-oxidoreductase subunit alpha n=1 Tax=Litoreibacter roseus TaxID=2601869 RepID=A0A6N6JBC1_9RHOB|nr:(2Fe-2S)-binding protein [Litoreibacter roseus]GFE63160.1 isoquinoline 1-oxidoreductase subunit alpha [Litoreibacter roseus]